MPGRVASAALLLATLVALPARARDASARTTLEGFVWNTSPVALQTGLVTGGGAEMRRLFGSQGLFFGAELALGQSEEATNDWVLDDLDGLASVEVGLERTFGVGTLRASFSLGTLAVEQLGQRAQFDRLKAAGLHGLTRNAASIGPYAAVDLGAAIAFAGAWTFFVQLGPAFTVQKVAGQERSRWLLTSGLGVGRGF